MQNLRNILGYYKEKGIKSISKSTIGKVIKDLKNKKITEEKIVIEKLQVERFNRTLQEQKNL